jgi:hypothetical protein
MTKNRYQQEVKDMLIEKYDRRVIQGEALDHVLVQIKSEVFKLHEKHRSCHDIEISFSSFEQNDFILHFDQAITFPMYQIRFYHINNEL